MKQETITNSNITGKHWRSVMIMINKFCRFNHMYHRVTQKFFNEYLEYADIIKNKLFI